MDIEAGELVVLHSERVCVHYNRNDAARMRSGRPQGPSSHSSEPCMAVRGFDTCVARLSG